MKVITNIALVCVLCLVAATSASAKVRSRVVSFGQDFAVNGTPVKAGTYKLVFDDKTNEFMVLDKRSKTVVAKAVGRLEKREGSRYGMDVTLETRNGAQAVISVAFPGDSQRISITDAPAAASSL
jgi:hypothetical protein